MRPDAPRRALWSLAGRMAPAAMLLFGLGCSDNSDIGPGPIIAVRVTPDTLRIVVGSVDSARAFPLDASGAYIPNQPTRWTTGNTNVATVDGAGRVAGVALGTTTLTASVAGLSGTAVVEVTPPPLIVTNPDPVRFTAFAGSGVTLSTAVTLTNGAGGLLSGLALDSITYNPTPGAWLQSALLAAAAPTQLTIDAATTGLAVGQYLGTVWISSPVATNSPHRVAVVLDVVTPGPSVIDHFTLNSTDNQTARPGTAVASPPSVVALDGSNNPVPNVAVTFTVSAGGGSVNCGSGSTSQCNVITDGSGVATVVSWSLGNTGVPVSGTYSNSLTASASGATSLGFSATAAYSFALDVTPIFTTNACTSACHGYDFTRASIVNQAASLNAGCGTLVVPGNASGSFLQQKLDNTQAGGCGGGMPPGNPPLPAATRQVIRDWIDNNALNN